MVKEIIIRKKTLHFIEPFKIAYEEAAAAEIVIIKITGKNGLVGLGSAAPDTEVTGETIASVLTVLNKKLNQKFFDAPIDRWYYYHEKIQKNFKGFPSAQSAVEEAVLNLFAKEQGINLTSIFGGYRESAPTNVTIGIKNLSETVAEAKERMSEGFKLIKLKCGLDLKNDIQRIKAVRNVLPTKVKLLLDANQGYSLAEAKKLLQAVKNLKISLVEQPIDSKNWNGLKKLKSMKLAPIIADESAVAFDDAFHLLTRDYVDGINTKLMKCGGPINFLKIFYLAKSLDKIIMLGCMYESNISLTTAAHLSLALPIDFVELDSGHLDFSDDPAIGGIEIKNGQVTIPEQLDLNEAKIL